ncbi:MAG: ABC transporter ATP-binding protein, partial [Propionibacteriaceae bacterium]|nr:ABC transporter ATP-binding protein [Propionibacteriaceae bacterium]
APGSDPAAVGEAGPLAARTDAPATGPTTAIGPTAADGPTIAIGPTAADGPTTAGPAAEAGPAAGGQPLLEIERLRVDFPAERVRAVDDLSLRLAPGEVVALVGESGSGKTMTVSAAVGLLPVGAQLSGQVRFQGRSLTDLDYDQWRAIRGSQISIILQDPMTSLNPVLTVFRHFKETLQTLSDRRVVEAEVRRRAVELMEAVGITRAPDRLYQYPHELSGGMRQRVVIALAIVSRPQLIIADEPTTALDVTVQARVLDSLEAARASVGAAMIFITHDLALVAGLVDRVLVMKDGRLVEAAPVDDLFARPSHPYTQTLLARVPRLRRGPRTGGRP